MKGAGLEPGDLSGGGREMNGGLDWVGQWRWVDLRDMLDYIKMCDVAGRVGSGATGQSSSPLRTSGACPCLP